MVGGCFRLNNVMLVLDNSISLCRHYDNSCMQNGIPVKTGCDCYYRIMPFPDPNPDYWDNPDSVSPSYDLINAATAFVDCPGVSPPMRTTLLMHIATSSSSNVSAILG